jgi:hypothetical protein
LASELTVIFSGTLIVCLLSGSLCLHLSVDFIAEVLGILLGFGFSLTVDLLLESGGD